MACMYGRCRRVVGVGVRCVWRWRTVLWCMHGVCVGTVYGVQALGVRMVYVVCMCRVVYVVCTCVCRYIDVVSV